VAGHRIFAVSFASIYSHYMQKAERKNRSKHEVDQAMAAILRGGSAADH